MFEVAIKDTAGNVVMFIDFFRTKGGAYREARSRVTGLKPGQVVQIYDGRKNSFDYLKA